MVGTRHNSTVGVSPQDIPFLVKESQMCGQKARTFLVDGRKVRLSFDGMFIIDTLAGEPIDERVFSGRQITAVLN